MASACQSSTKPGAIGSNPASRCAQQRRHQQPGGEARHASRERRRADLQQVYARDVAARRAQHLERGDAGAPRLQIGGNPAADADPGNHQRGKTDENQELAHARNEAVGPRRGIVAGAEFEPGIGKARLDRVDRGLWVDAARQQRAGLALVHRPRRGQSGAFGHRIAHHGDIAEVEAFAEHFGLAGDDPADFQRGSAHGDARSGPHLEPLGSAFGKVDLTVGRRADASSILQQQLAHHRPVAIDCLQCDRRGPLAVHRDGLHPVTGGDRPELAHLGHFFGSQAALPDAHLDVAAKDRASSRCQFALDRAGEGADRGKRANPEEQAYQ